MANFIRQLRKTTTGLPSVVGIPQGVILVNTADGTLSFPKADQTGWNTFTPSAVPSFALAQERFTGTGAQTTFQTASTSSTVSHFIVAVGGVFQSANTDYTVANGLITFADPPPSGEEINVLIASGGQTGPQGPAGPAGPSGADGAVGPAGPAGQTGLQGIQGPVGPQGAAGVNGQDGQDALWNYTGAYHAGIAYQIGDIATADGSLWYRKATGTAGQAPSTSSPVWDQIAAKGEQGPAGPAGPLNISALTGDVTASGSGSVTATLSTISGLSAGTTGSATSVPVITNDAKGRITAVSSATITAAAIGAEPTITALPLTRGGTGATTSAGARAALSLGSAALLEAPLGSNAAPNQVVAGTDTRLTDSRVPKGNATGDLSGTYPSPTVAAIRGVGISATAPQSGQILRYSGTAWEPSAETAGNGITALSGDVTATGPGSAGATLASIAGLSAGTTGSASTVPVITNDTKGRVTSITSATITPAAIGAEPLIASLPLAKGGTGATTATQARTNLGLGTAATKSTPATGNAASTEVVQGNDTRLTDARTPVGSASGDLGGSYPAPTVTKIQSQPVSSATPAANQVLTYVNGTWTPTTPTSQGGITALTGDVTASGTGSAVATLKTVTTAKTVGSANTVPVVTTDAQGRVTTLASATITPAAIGAEPVFSTLLVGKLPAFTGDISTVAGSNFASVTRLQNRSVATTIPNDSEVLTWDDATSSWTPKPSATGSTTLTGDVSTQVVSGQTVATVTKINGQPVNALAPTKDWVLTWNGTAWSAAPFTFIKSLTGDVTAAINGVAKVEKLQNKPVATTVPSAGDILTWTSAGQWEPKPNTATPNITGDVTVSGSAATVVKIQGTPISNTAPSEGNILAYSAGSWKSTNAPIYNLTGDVIATNDGTSRLATIPNLVASTYGTGAAVPVITNDAKGRITAISTAPITASAIGAEPVITTLPVNRGGTGQTTYSNGQLLIGNAGTLSKATLTGANGISITNGAGSVTISPTYGTTANTVAQGNTVLTKTGDQALAGTISVQGSGTDTSGVVNITNNATAAKSLSVKNGTGEHFTVDSDGTVTVDKGPLQITTQDRSGASIVKYGNDSNQGALTFVKTRGTTPTAYPRTPDGDVLGRIAFAGCDGTSTVEGAYIMSVAQGLGTQGTNVPANLQFYTQALTSGVPTTSLRFQINASGTARFYSRLGIGTDASTTYSLKVSNGIQFNDGSFLTTCNDLSSKVTLAGDVQGTAATTTVNGIGGTPLSPGFNPQEGYVLKYINGYWEAQSEYASNRTDFESVRTKYLLVKAANDPLPATTHPSVLFAIQANSIYNSTGDRSTIAATDEGQVVMGRNTALGLAQATTGFEWKNFCRSLFIGNQIKLGSTYKGTAANNQGTIESVAISPDIKAAGTWFTAMRVEPYTTGVTGYADGTPILERMTLLHLRHGYNANQSLITNAKQPDSTDQSDIHFDNTGFKKLGFAGRTHSVIRHTQGLDGLGSNLTTTTKYFAYKFIDDRGGYPSVFSEQVAFGCSLDGQTADYANRPTGRPDINVGSRGIKFWDGSRIFQGHRSYTTTFNFGSANSQGKTATGTLVVPPIYQTFGGAATQVLTNQDTVTFGITGGLKGGIPVAWVETGATDQYGDTSMNIKFYIYNASGAAINYGTNPLTVYLKVTKITEPALDLHPEVY